MVSESKAAAYSAAAEDIAEERADEVRVGSRVYRVVRTGRDRLDRFTLYEGTRADVLAALETYRAERSGGPGRLDKSAPYVRAIECVRLGLTRVRVRNVAWEVSGCAQR